MTRWKIETRVEEIARLRIYRGVSSRVQKCVAFVMCGSTGWPVIKTPRGSIHYSGSLSRPLLRGFVQALFVLEVISHAALESFIAELNEADDGYLLTNDARDLEGMERKYGRALRKLRVHNRKPLHERRPPRLPRVVKL